MDNVISNTYHRIRQLIKPPVFQNDEDKTHTAYLLNTTLWVMLAVVLVVTAILPFITEDLLKGIPPVGFNILLLVGMLALLRNGRVQLSSWLFTFFMWLFDSALIALSGGADTPIVASLLTVIIIAGLLLGGRVAFLFAGLSIASKLIITSMVTTGALPPAILPIEGPGRFVLLASQDIVAASLLYLATRSIRQGLARVLASEQQLTESNRELQDAHLALEERNHALQEAQAALERRAERLQTTVREYDEYMAQVAQGNLISRIELNGNRAGADDPLVRLGQRLNETVASLHQMIAQIRDAAMNITSAASEILSATTQQASGVTEQSSAISQTSITIDEVKTIVEQSFNKAKEVAEKASHSKDVSHKGEQAVVDSITKMTEIKDRVSGIAENIIALSEQTQQIGEIIATVNDIASQSNLLALNASVEAARAGEHGKGFNVVAVEVRNLAEQSKQATAQVKGILNEIQKATNAAVLATEEGTKGVDFGVAQTEQTGKTIKELASSVAENASSAQQIVASAQQQTTGMEQIALAMQNINQAATQNQHSIRQAETAAQDLSRLAQQMEKLVAQYRL